MNPSRRIAIFPAVLGILTLLLISTGCGVKKQPAVKPLARLGWQIPWATQGQLVQALKHTTILDQYPVQVEFKGFSYGGPLNEAALAGEVDIILTADQPAATLLSRNENWTIVGRMMYNRVAIYVPPHSPIETLADLKGKTVAIPFGAAAQRDALRAMKNVGLDPQKDVKCVNLDIYEQSSIVQLGDSSNWGQIDALVGFDPTPAMFEVTGKARMLHVGKVVSLIVINNAFIAAHPDAVVAFLEAFQDAYLYFARYPDVTGQWFQKESRLEFDPQVLAVCASVEPNYRAKSKSDVSLQLAESDLAVMQEAADFIFEQGLVKKQVNMRAHVNLRFLNQAEKSWRERPDDEFQIRKTE
ncbi:MAG: ABC transporter substrate-binding protein [bacterium]